MGVLGTVLHGLGGWEAAAAYGCWGRSPVGGARRRQPSKGKFLGQGVLKKLDHKLSSTLPAEAGPEDHQVPVRLLKVERLGIPPSWPDAPSWSGSDLPPPSRIPQWQSPSPSVSLSLDTFLPCLRGPGSHTPGASGALP